MEKVKANLQHEKSCKLVSEIIHWKRAKKVLIEKRTNMASEKNGGHIFQSVSNVKSIQMWKINLLSLYVWILVLVISHSRLKNWTGQENFSPI